MPERDRPDLTETFIVLRAQTGDVEAFDALYRIYAPILLRHLRSNGHPAHAPDAANAIRGRRYFLADCEGFSAPPRLA
jgi:hypothetical protein